MKTKMSSKERILATLNHQPTDHIPLCFDGICHGMVTFVNRMYPDPYKKAEFYLGLGADTAIRITPPLVSNAGFKTREQKKTVSEEPYPILTREYITPRGILFQQVRKTEDYPDSIGLFSDHNVPASRSMHFLVEHEDDLEKLEYILWPPAGKELDEFYKQAKEAKKFCDQHGILLSSYLSGVGDPLMWLSGIERVLIASLQDPGFLHNYIEIVSQWNLKRMEIMIGAGVDLINRRGWYESTDFWSPDLYKEFLFAPLQKEVEMARQAGVKFGYVMNSGSMPLLGHFNDLGFDLYSNIDPVTPQTDLAQIKQQVGNRMALCGGVNNTQVLEQGSEADVGKAVQEAVEVMAPGGGFILAPGDSLMLKTDEITKRNFYSMVDAWKGVRG